MDLLAGSVRIDVHVASSGLVLPERASTVSAVHKLQEDSLEQLLRPSEIADPVRPSMPLRHAGQQLCNEAGWGQHDAGPGVASKMRREGDCFYVLK